MLLFPSTTTLRTIFMLMIYLMLLHATVVESSNMNNCIITMYEQIDKKNVFIKRKASFT